MGVLNRPPQSKENSQSKNLRLFILPKLEKDLEKDVRDNYNSCWQIPHRVQISHSNKIENNRCLPHLCFFHWSNSVCLLLSGWYLSLQCIPLWFHFLCWKLHSRCLFETSGQPTKQEPI